MNSNGAQDWRAVAIIAAGGERLLCLGESASQVRAAYTGAWSEVIRDEDRPTVKQISLQKWTGKVWQGQWEHDSWLNLPTARGGKSAGIEEEEVEGDPDDAILDEETIADAQEMADRGIEEVEDEEG